MTIGEGRLDAIRAEAAQHGTVDGGGVKPAGAPFPQATPESGYYGLPLLKPPTWTWEVPAYFFVGGAAGAASVIAAAAQDEDLAQDARWIAAIGGGVSSALLTSDLGRPERFLNMLRVFKIQSPMSVGAWTLAAFSSASAASAFAAAVARRTGNRVPIGIVADASGMLAAATGLVMTTYTAVLIGATVIPAWNRNVRLLPVHFAASGLGSAVSLLELAGHDNRALNVLGIAAAAVETIAGALIELDDSPDADPLRGGASGAITRAGGVLSGPVPLLLRLVGAGSPSLRRAAAAATLAGALLTRFGWWAAGSESSRDARLPLQSPGDLETTDDRRPRLDRRAEILGDHRQDVHGSADL